METSSTRWYEALGRLRYEKANGTSTIDSSRIGVDFIDAKIGNVQMKGPFLTNRLEPIPRAGQEAALKTVPHAIRTNRAGVNRFWVDLAGLDADIAQRMQQQLDQVRSEIGVRIDVVQ